ncbi:MAG: hypothetical protein HYR62_04145 [Actinobacteria bacterium]|nr:hypothetical protein [Actinomycetota bacterium]MBI3686608.1 hypothetical protein [Actinomycetota bacterium]
MIVGLSLLGTSFRLAARDDAVLTELGRLFGPFAAEPTVDALTVHVGHGASAAEALADLVAHLNATALDRADCFAVHAGVVGHEGVAAAFPAPSGAGKSTLVAACLRAGLGYVSDEALCVPWAGDGVLPYPRPLALSPWACRLLDVALPRALPQDPPRDPAVGGERYLVPADLGAAPAAGPLRLGHVILLDRRPGAAASLRPARRQEAAGALLARSFTHYTHPQRAFELAHELAGAGQPWRLTFDDPRPAAALVSALLTG